MRLAFYYKYIPFLAIEYRQVAERDHPISRPAATNMETSLLNSTKKAMVVQRHPGQSSKNITKATDDRTSNEHWDLMAWIYNDSYIICDIDIIYIYVIHELFIIYIYILRKCIPKPLVAGPSHIVSLVIPMECFWCLTGQLNQLLTKFKSNHSHELKIDPGVPP